MTETRLEHLRLECVMGSQDAGGVLLGHVEAGHEVEPLGDPHEEVSVRVGEPAGGLGAFHL